jgi:hypothetical protein
MMLALYALEYARQNRINLRAARTTLLHAA